LRNRNPNSPNRNEPTRPETTN